MLRLRPYKNCDANYIVSWCNSKEIFSFWGGERFGQFPISPEIINDKYINHNGDCIEEDNFYPLTAVDDDGPVGHFIIRYINGDIPFLNELLLRKLSTMYRHAVFFETEDSNKIKAIPFDFWTQS